MKVTVGKIKKRKIILLNFVILLFVAYWLGVFLFFIDNLMKESCFQ